MTFDITIYGTRGSVPTPGIDYLEFGGNTASILVEIDGRPLVFDAGTGLINLGYDLQERNVSTVDLFLSHPHYDHLLGLPFFPFLYDGKADLTVWSAGSNMVGSTQDVIDLYVSPPFFPVLLEKFAAKTKMKTFVNNDVLDLNDGVIVKTIDLHHPGGSTGFRVEKNTMSFCYITDVEHDNGEKDDDLVAFMENADFVLIDAPYSDEQYQMCCGYGHATWNAAAELCARAKVKRWGLFHHAFRATDAMLREAEAMIKKRYPAASFAREGECIRLERSGE